MTLPKEHLAQVREALTAVVPGTDEGARLLRSALALLRDAEQMPAAAPSASEVQPPALSELYLSTHTHGRCAGQTVVAELATGRIVGVLAASAQPQGAQAAEPSDENDLDPRRALAYARQMKAYCESFNGRDWPTAIATGPADTFNLAGALDNLTECAAMLMNMADRVLAASPTATQPERNQCDGCVQGAPLRGNLHIDAEGHSFMVCQREKYAATQGAAATEPTDMLKQRIAELTKRHGSLRAAARVLMVDPGYLSRLASGEKVDPGEDLLRRLKLRRIVSYESTTAPQGAPCVAAAGKEQP